MDKFRTILVKLLAHDYCQIVINLYLVNIRKERKQQNSLVSPVAIHIPPDRKPRSHGMLMKIA